MATTRDWDAASYQRLGSPIRVLGLELLDRLELDGDALGRRPG